MVEHLFCKQVVRGSIPLVSSAESLPLIDTNFEVTKTKPYTEIKRDKPWRVTRVAKGSRL